VERYIPTIIETQVREEWPNVLWKIQLVHNTTIQKSIQMTPLRALIGIESSTPLIRAAQNDLACDLSPVQNLQANQERVKAALHQGNNWQHVACNIF
jgi:hypothetical protein